MKKNILKMTNKNIMMTILEEDEEDKDEEDKEDMKKKLKSKKWKKKEQAQMFGGSGGGLGGSSDENSGEEINNDAISGSRCRRKRTMVQTLKINLHQIFLSQMILASWMRQYEVGRRRNGELVLQLN